VRVELFLAACGRSSLGCVDCSNFPQGTQSPCGRSTGAVLTCRLLCHAWVSLCCHAQYGVHAEACSTCRHSCWVRFLQIQYLLLPPCATPAGFEVLCVGLLTEGTECTIRQGSQTAEECLRGVNMLRMYPSSFVCGSVCSEHSWFRHVVRSTHNRRVHAPCTPHHHMCYVPVLSGRLGSIATPAGATYPALLIGWESVRIATGSVLLRPAHAVAARPLAFLQLLAGLCCQQLC